MPIPTLEFLKKHLHYDPDTGVFTRLVGSSRSMPGDIAGTLEGRGYWAIRLPKMRHKAHRLAWLYMTGEWPDSEIDHINLNRLDNSWSNLRKVTHQQNLENISLVRPDGTFTGVSRDATRGKWRAVLQQGKRYFHLGYFNSEIEAHHAYVAAKKLRQTHYSMQGAATDGAM